MLFGMSASGRDDKFSIYVPKEDSAPEAPDFLEIVDTGTGGKPKNRMQGGAYDPYQKQEPGNPGDTARIRRPRVDLRQLSEWIKTTQRVKSLREAEAAKPEDQPVRKGPFRK